MQHLADLVKQYTVTSIDTLSRKGAQLTRAMFMSLCVCVYLLLNVSYDIMKTVNLHCNTHVWPICSCGTI